MTTSHRRIKSGDMMIAAARIKAKLLGREAIHRLAPKLLRARQQPFHLLRKSVSGAKLSCPFPLQLRTQQ